MDKIKYFLKQLKSELHLYTYRDSTSILDLKMIIIKTEIS